MPLSLARNRGELDEEKVPPFVPIPRLMGCGPRRPGYMPIRLLILLELIGKVTRPKPVTLNISELKSASWAAYSLNIYILILLYTMLPRLLHHLSSRMWTLTILLESAALAKRFGHGATLLHLWISTSMRKTTLLVLFKSDFSWGKKLIPHRFHIVSGLTHLHLFGCFKLIYIYIHIVVYISI